MQKAASQESNPELGKPEPDTVGSRPACALLWREIYTYRGSSLCKHLWKNSPEWRADNVLFSQHAQRPRDLRRIISQWEEKARPARNSHGTWAGSKMGQKERTNLAKGQIHIFYLFSLKAHPLLLRTKFRILTMACWPSWSGPRSCSQCSGPQNSSLPLLQPHWPSRCS